MVGISKFKHFYAAQLHFLCAPFVTKTDSVIPPLAAQVNRQNPNEKIWFEIRKLGV